MGRGQDGTGRWWCGGWKNQELDDHVLLLARKNCCLNSKESATKTLEAAYILYLSKKC
jgi:hypothetical protein